MTPDARHSRSMTEAKIAYAGPGVAEHISCCWLIYTAVTHDQLQGTQVASFEMAARRIQMSGLKYRD